MTTLIADPSVAALPVQDSGEPLVDLTLVGLAVPAGTGRLGRMVRVGVAERLVAAQAALPAGVGLLVVEGLRARAEQQHIHTRYLARVREAHPDLPDAELERLATRYVAPPDLAPHVAGAAVDLTLTGPGGQRLDLGCPLDATPEDSDGACWFDAPGIGVPARLHRELLATALGGAGLVNYPTEWWHWSYGDRYWALATGSSHAVYGPVQDPA